MTLTKAVLRRLPKAELHVHLDGSLRLGTVLELADADGVALPADTPDRLQEILGSRAASLEEYLRRYEHTVAVMQTAHALERIAYEFVVDAAAENVRYVEVRFCPALHTTKLTLPEVVETVLAGLDRGRADTGTRAALIVSALRSLSPLVSEDLARIAGEYRRHGVSGFDLAGVERGFPAKPHARAFAHAARCGLGRTCHAGEAEGPHSVREALEDCQAQRLGHGTRMVEDPSLEEWVRDHRVPLEVCLSSNVHTGTVDDVAEHPVRRYVEVGCVVTLNTDGRLMDRTSLTDELWLAHTRLDFSVPQIERLILNAFAAAFLSNVEKDALLADVREELKVLHGEGEVP